MICTLRPILFGWSKNEMGRHVARMWESRDVYRVLVGKPEGQWSLGRPRRRWEANIKMNLHEVECEGIDCIKLAQDRGKRRALVNAIMKLLVPYNLRNFLTSWKPICFSRGTLFHAISNKPTCSTVDESCSCNLCIPPKIR